jgi:hypothetical protein
VSDVRLQLSLPSTWYAYGDAVLDAISRTVRAESINVATPAASPTPAEVRRALKSPIQLNVVVSPAPHRIVCSLDAIVLTPDRRFFDLLTGHHIHEPQWPLRVTPFTPDLAARDALRLKYVIDAYPELKVDDEFRAKIQADVAFLEKYRNTFPDLATAFLEYEPLTAWRAR